jgi:low affinity Fe/Cu permease
VKNAFQSFAQWASPATGTVWAFTLALAVILVWFVTGPRFGFSDTWQLVINTGTTIVTFIMVFLIQHTQNKDTIALHAKVDELIIKLRAPDNQLVGAEDTSDDELAALISHEKTLAKVDEGSASPHPEHQRLKAGHLASHALTELKRRKGGAKTTVRNGSKGRFRFSWPQPQAGEAYITGMTVYAFVTQHTRA